MESNHRALAEGERITKHDCILSFCSAVSKTVLSLFKNTVLLPNV